MGLMVDRKYSRRLCYLEYVVVLTRVTDIDARNMGDVTEMGTSNGQ